jgi:hypothetical protein
MKNISAAPDSAAQSQVLALSVDYVSVPMRSPATSIILAEAVRRGGFALPSFLNYADPNHSSHESRWLRLRRAVSFCSERFLKPEGAESLLHGES